VAELLSFVDDVLHDAELACSSCTPTLSNMITWRALCRAFNLRHHAGTACASVYSAAEWLACWTQAQKGLGSNRSRDAVG